ncbi:UDP-N-acetylmuramoyl-L-alanyl-D-glutamate--2,6-diaminopimelate ligase [Sneathiella sp.]|jgi:UDP-N-acetylmuramoyl-L-alanyl-D-glutamate--2,6-diaminopimelate ligase|uniref:UDP-N-acetylmuramoyl-L-alanyl-D-glutamate--2, 6-diaminopimelate ligase n=1 Tax=Sneathiella sp. TaxID=1964365 RepID=UPI0039E50EF9
MKLSDLLQIDPSHLANDVDVKGLTADSREVAPGYIFAALVGTGLDGRNYIKSAVEQGAIAILTDSGYEPSDCPIYCHQVDNPRRELAFLAARFYKKVPQTVVAVTGTNGKTSVAHFVREIWQGLGLQAASLGTLGVVTAHQTLPLNYTTPEPVLLHKKLAYLVDEGVTHLALEASSHGLDQNRLDGIEICAGGFTNLTHDHLDYHESKEDYLKAKLGLVDRVVAVGGAAVLNADVPDYFRFKDAAETRGLSVLSYGHSGDQLKILDVTSHGAGQDITLEAFGNRCVVELKVAGEFQAMNMLCALGLIISAGGDFASALSVLPTVGNVPGRMELVSKTPAGADVYVDFAHTPDALETVLKALRPHAHGAIHAIIGCGGDRDKTKRPVMGRVAAEFADIVYVTDDNPRTENAAQIRSEILAACPQAKEFADREKAIHEALSRAANDDIVLIAGKGHESGQIIGDTVIPFNDKEVAQRITSRLEAGK